MKCNIIRDLLPLYCDDMASEESVEEIEKHLAECEECKKVYEDMKNGRIELKSNFDELDPLKKIRRKIWLMRIAAILTVVVIVLSGCYLFLCKNPSLARSKKITYDTETDFYYNSVYLYETDGKKGYVDIPLNAEVKEDTVKNCVYADNELLKDTNGNTVPSGGRIVQCGAIKVKIDVDTSLKCVKSKIDMYGANMDVWLYPCLPFRQDIGNCYSPHDDIVFDFSIAECLMNDSAVLTIHCKDKEIHVNIKELAEEAVKDHNGE